jgi:hypothetical protein
MALSQEMLEEVAAWCRGAPEVEGALVEARARFFGDDDERPISYWVGAGDITSKERRFLGYFLFDWSLSSGERPSEAGIKRLYRGGAQAEALAAVAGARFVFAVVSSATGRSVSLEIEDEAFEVRNARWAGTLAPGLAVAAHLVPVGHERWLLGPGWVNLGFKIGPGMRASLKSMQTDPLALERMLQGRRDKDKALTAPQPVDDSLDAAVARMTEWARTRGHHGLIMPPSKWEALVLKHLPSLASPAFHAEIFALAQEVASEDQLQELAGLASNIWNNTPQPDRDGRTANQMLGLAREPTAR